MNITRDELREVILGLKNQGMTFEGISDKLEEMYGIKRDRQSVYGIYKRYIDKLERDKEKSRGDIDIINICARIDVFTTARKFIAELNGGVSDYYIRNAIEKYSADIKIVQDELVDIIIDGLRTGSTKEEILGNISYKGIDVAESVYNRLATEAFRQKITNSIESIVALSIAHNGNTDIAKELIKEFPTGNSVTVIKNKYL